MVFKWLMRETGLLRDERYWDLREKRIMKEVERENRKELGDIRVAISHAEVARNEKDWKYFLDRLSIIERRRFDEENQIMTALRVINYEESKRRNTVNEWRETRQVMKAKHHKRFMKNTLLQDDTIRRLVAKRVEDLLNEEREYINRIKIEAKENPPNRKKIIENLRLLLIIKKDFYKFLKMITQGSFQTGQELQAKGTAHILKLTEEMKKRAL